MKRSRLTLSCCLSDEEPTPAVGGGCGRQEDGIVGHQGKARRCGLAAASSLERFVERQGEGRELTISDQLEHGSTSLHGRAIAGFLLAEQVEILELGDRRAFGGVAGNEALVEERDGCLLPVQLLHQPAFAFLDRLRDVVG